MTKIDIISGFLGAGKTTLIKKLIKEGYEKQKIVIIENEFGQIGIDGGFLKESGINITEMNSGCICCSLVGDFSEALVKVIEEFKPDRVIIEPSGVGKLSDVIAAVNNADCKNTVLNTFTAVVDAKKCKLYHKNFGEFFNNQIENAKTIILSHTKDIPKQKLDDTINIIKELNSSAVVVTTDWNEITGKQIVDAMETSRKNVQDALDINHKHHHHHHEHDEHCDCGCHEHEHHHHEHDEHCDCGCHDHEHHHHHHADEVFTSWGIETTTKFSKDRIKNILDSFSDNNEIGTVLRAKGIVDGDGEWIHFDYIPAEVDIRTGSADIIGRVCVIGSNLNEQKLEELFK